MSRTLDDVIQFCTVLKPTDNDEYAEGYNQALENVLLFIRNDKVDLSHMNEWLAIIPSAVLQERLGGS
jgi:hypothetical protein